MNKMFVIIGKGGSGKNTIYKRILNHEYLGLKPVILYTTRPKRPGEICGEDYYFVSKWNFWNRFEAVETRSYTIEDGTCWSYGTMCDSQLDNNDHITINTIEGYNGLKKELTNTEVIPIYIYVPSEDDQESRTKNRPGTSLAENNRRLEADKKDFCEEVIKSSFLSEQCFCNDNLDDCVNEIIDYIIQKLGE